MDYSKPKTEKEFVDLFKYIAKEEFNYDCDVPVSINTKLYACNGRYLYELNKNKVPQVIGFDFSIDMINSEESLDEILNTIRHELVHWYTNVTEQRECGHNEIFIKNCEKFGVTDSTDFERYKPRKRLNKNEYHEARCCNCDRVVARSKNMKHLQGYMNRYGGTVCSCGGNGDRYIIDKKVRYVYQHGGMHPFGFKIEEEWYDYLLEHYNVELFKE